MKKVLFATTALVATAGVAAADVSFGGYARFGAIYIENAAEETTMESRLRLIVTATAEADNGLSFGAQTRYQANEMSNGYAGNAGFNAPRFWVSTGGLEISMGHVQGALEYMPGMYAGSVGLTGLGYRDIVYNYAADNYTSGAPGRQGVDVKYAAGAFSAHLSHSFDNAYNGNFDRTALVVAYTMGDYSVAVAGQDSDIVGDTTWALTASGNFGPAAVTLQVADNDGDMKYGVSASFEAGAATTIIGYVNHDEAIDDENYGVGVKHKLGGGASIEGGVVSLGGLAGSTTRADLGLKFSF
ncbi:porin [Thalassovita taeanensis]|uniref:Outer membrane protein OmpU n=1 Tax=Thalassovita taeanensis TaxID=657014 RepID=A0A1H9CHK1_9RHOB|nr:porin [Thalassovita taeanensis]SEQ00531.1 outer membrane protein OmpU [Thalassovita taeanensis]